MLICGLPRDDFETHGLYSRGVSTQIGRMFIHWDKNLFVPAIFVSNFHACRGEELDFLEAQSSWDDAERVAIAAYNRT